MKAGANETDAAQRRRIKPVAPTLAARLRAFAARRDTRVYAESVVMTAILPLVGLVVQPTDPLFLKNGFSWLALPPIVVALRHGFGPGVTSALLLFVVVFFVRRSGHPGLSGLPSELLYGVMLVTMIVGQVAAAMTRRFDKLEGGYRHLRAQFDGFSRSYMLLELSHERLEQRAVSGLSSLRAALSTLFERVTTAPADEADPRARVALLSEKALAVMATYGRVQAAGIHLVREDGTVDPEAVASIGASHPLLPDDTLVEVALETGEVVHSPGRTEDTVTDLLVAVPLLDARQTRVGIVAIRALPFVALEASNLRLLYVVAGYAADAMSASAGDASAREDRWGQFVGRLERAAADARDVRTPAALMAFASPKAQRGTEVLEMLIAKDLRSTDFPLLRRDGTNNPLLLIVLPLTDRDGTLAFRARVDRLSRERYGADLAALGVTTTTWLLREDKPEAVLAAIAKMEAHAGADLAAPSR